MVRPPLKWTAVAWTVIWVDVEAVNPTEFSQENPVRLRGTVLPFIGAETRADVVLCGCYDMAGSPH